MAQSITERITELENEIAAASSERAILINSIQEYKSSNSGSAQERGLIIAKYQSRIAELDAEILSEQQAIAQIKGTGEYTQQLKADIETAKVISDSSATQKKVGVYVLIAVVVIVIGFFIYKKYFA